MTITLLIVDDSQINRRKYSCYLNSDRLCGYLIWEAGNLEQAQKIFENQEPDIILLDLQSPDGYGSEFLDWMKQQGKLSLIPTLLMAHQKDEILASKITQTGIQDYLIKEHVTPARLERSLGNLLARMQLLNTISDIVNLRKRAEEIRAEKEEKFLCLVECSDDVIWSSNLEGKFIYLSPQFTELFGWEAGDWIGKSMIDLVHVGDRQRFQEHIYQILANNQKSDIPVEFRHLQKDGSYVWVSTNMAPVQNKGEAIAIQGISRDISDRIALAYAIRERKLVETRLRDTNQILASVNQELIRSPCF